MKHANVRLEKQYMASRTERCSSCGLLLLVPPEVQTIRCPKCEHIFTIRSSFHDAFGLVNRALNRFGYSASGTVVPRFANPGNGLPRAGITISPPFPYGKRRALLCGVSYRGKSYGLKGSINDVLNIRSLLTENLRFPRDSILMLTEDETDPYRIPTKQNIRRALQWLVQGCQPGDSLVFYYSGHGTRQLDYAMDELDGFDEALCPLDHETEGLIIDNEINATIVRPLTRGVTLHAIIDACHSGTVLDLQFLCRMNSEGFYMWEDQRTPSPAFKGTNGGLALCISSCDDNQISVNTTAFPGTSATTGAMTSSFIQAVRSEPGLTYGRLLTAMRSVLREVKNDFPMKGRFGNFVNKALFGPQPSQEPQLCSSEKFDVYSRQFRM